MIHYEYFVIIIKPLDLWSKLVDHYISTSWLLMDRFVIFDKIFSREGDLSYLLASKPMKSLSLAPLPSIPN